MKDLVQLLQQQKYSSYCKRHNSCRFSFPKPPSHETLIAQPESDPDVVKQAQSVLAKVHIVIADGHTDKSLDEVLVLANVRGPMLHIKSTQKLYRCPIREVLWYSSVNPVNAWWTTMMAQ